jgi:hypothetical protein
MLHLYRVVLVLSLFTLSSFSHAKDKLEIVGCLDEQSILCKSVDKQREYAFYLARKDTPSALVGTNSAKLDYVIQSDFSNTVTHFKFSVLKDYEVVEGPDGRDMFLPVNRLQLIKQASLSGSGKEEILDMMSIKRGTENLSNSSGVGLNGDNTLDYDATCGQTSGAIENDRNIKTMLTACENFFWDSGAFTNAGSNFTVSTGLAGQLGASLTAEKVFKQVLNFSFGLDLKVDYSKVETMTLKWGSPVRFKTTDGYILVLKPHENGITEATRFIVPPNVVVPITTDGELKLEIMEEKLLDGSYTFNQDNLRFISLLAARMTKSKFVMLEHLLLQGFECPNCTTEIVDQLTGQLGGGQQQ